MKIGIFTALFGEWPLEQVARYVSGLGYEAVELPVWAGNKHLSLEEVLAGRGREVKKMLADHGLSISAISHGVAGQLSLGPLDSSTDVWAPGMSPEQKVAYAVEQLKSSARAASELEVPVVTGLIGSHVWDKWYIFPPTNEKLYDEGFQLFAERWNPVLDEFKKYGVKWGLEVHPTEIAYNLETAQQALETLDNRPEFGFNFDPSHLVWQLIDPVIFVKTFGQRIFHCHAKDAELQEDEVRRSGVIPTGRLDPARPWVPLPGAGLGTGGLAARDDRPGLRRLRLRAVLRARGPRDVPRGRRGKGDRLPAPPGDQEAAGAGLVVNGRREPVTASPAPVCQAPACGG